MGKKIFIRMLIILQAIVIYPVDVSCLIAATPVCIEFRHRPVKDTLIVTNTVEITDSVTYDYVFILNGAILILNGKLIVQQDFLIENGGRVTHGTRYESGLEIVVNGNFEIQQGGSIDVSAKGLRGGFAGSVYSPDGEAYNQNGQIIAGAKGGDNQNNPGWGGAGGSYGGEGSYTREAGDFPPIHSNPVYGLLETPDRLGAGGGGSPCGGCNQAGGAGGGLVRIQANNLLLNGIISANGEDATGGAGAGGGIQIRANSISGNGTIEANGGSGSWFFYIAGSGSGGRIALYYDTLMMPIENISLRSGNGQTKGSCGTLYLKQNSQANGVLLITNQSILSNRNTYLNTALSAFQKIAIYGKTNFQLNAPNVSIDTISVEDATLSLLNNFEISNGQILDLRAAAILNIEAGAMLILPFFNNAFFKPGGLLHLKKDGVLLVNNNRITIPDGLIFVKDGSLGLSDIINDIEVENNGILTHSSRFLEGLKLNISDSLVVHQGGAIDVLGKGYRGGGASGSEFGLHGETVDSHGNIVQGATTVSYPVIAGGSYGGWGKHNGGIPNPPYGLVETPVFLGSGGSCTSAAGGARGGSGGGRLDIQTVVLVNNGLISANGANGVGSDLGNGQYGCGGSGGSIVITANALVGIGEIRANGGYGMGLFGTTNVAGGGGGRIAIIYTSLSIPLTNISAAGGGNQFAGAGTVFLKGAAGNGYVLYDNNNHVWTMPTPHKSSLTNFDSIIIKNQARVTFETDLSLPNAGQFSMQENAGVFIENGAKLTLAVFDTTNISPGVFSICPTCRLDVLSETITIVPGLTLIKDGRFGVQDRIGNFTLKSGSYVTHTARSLPGLTLRATAQLRIEQNAFIDLDHLGLLGGRHFTFGFPASAFNPAGEAFSPDGTQIVLGGGSTGFYASGASFGGIGGVAPDGTLPNQPYGDQYFPNLLGAGGGSGNANGFGEQLGGNGGGKVLLQARHLIMDGQAVSRGGNGNFIGSGGTGGSVLVFADSISGQGNIKADGGNESCYNNFCGGAGGGGRIAIYTHQPDFPAENLHAEPGFGALDRLATSGTIVYLNCGFENNVGIDTILYPQTGVVLPPDTTIVPLVVVRNYAPGNLVFPVTFDIGSGYHDESYVSLASGQRDTIAFAPYTAALPGTLVAIAKTNRQGDDCTQTNQKTVNVATLLGVGPVITEVSPGSGGNTGAVTLRIDGLNFKNGIRAWLLSPDSAMLDAHYVEVQSGELLYASFNLQGADLGLYDVVVQNPDMQSSTFQDGFEVKAGSIGWQGFAQPGCLSGNFDPGQLLEVEVLYPATVRQGRVFPVQVVYKNQGNIDIPVPTKVLTCELVGFDPGKDYIGFIGFTPESAKNDGLRELTIELSEPGGPPNILRAGTSGTISLYGFANTSLTQSYPSYKMIFKIRD